MQRSASTARSGRSAGVRTAGSIAAADSESLVVHVQLRPRRGATRKCLAALASLATEHESVPFAITGLSKDDRVVKVTVGIDLGPRAGVAKFSPQAQAAYAFVSAIFTSLYDHMPVYTTEPTAEERAAAATLLGTVAGEVTGERPAVPVPPAADPEAALVPAPRPPDPSRRISA